MSLSMKSLRVLVRPIIFLTSSTNLNILFDVNFIKYDGLMNDSSTITNPMVAL